MSKHTLGPWTDCGGAICCVNGEQLLEVIPFARRPKNEADASLIAAAPDLLAALKAIVLAWEVTGGMSFKNNEIGNARAAITRATGGAS